MPAKLSVVLSTFNRARSLRVALGALLRQTGDPTAHEVIVVDNNSTDDTARVVAACADPRVRLVRETRQGLSWARNTGIAAAAGAFIAFTDDDVEVAPDWVETILAAFERRPDIDGVGGRVLPLWDGSPPAWLTRAHWAPLALQDHGPQPRTFDKDRPAGLVGASLAFRRGVFERIGVFAPDVQRVAEGIGSTEDHELLSRLYAAGGRMLYEPAVVVSARVQDERCQRRYHRRWHTGHGRFHARMRDAAMEQSRLAPLGIPGHLIRSAVRDAGVLARALLRKDRDAAFAAELRLRFVGGFARERLSDPPRRPSTTPLATVPLEEGLVSVVIPCCNHGRYLAEAIASATAAACRVEVVVVDDGSEDDTSAIARASGARCVRQSNRGLAAARNRGLQEARGEFVVFLDADDRLLPGAIDRGAGELRSRSGTAMVFGRCVMMDEGGRLLPTPARPIDAGDAHAAFLRTNLVWTPGAAMFRRDAVAALGGFVRGVDAAADYDLYLRITRGAPARDHGGEVVAYRQHASNMSRSATRMLHETLRVMRWHRPGGGALLSAWREGVRGWRGFYGTHLVEEIRAHRRRREWRALVRKAAVLVRRHPSLAGREAVKKLRLLGRPRDTGG